MKYRFLTFGEEILRNAERYNSHLDKWEPFWEHAFLTGMRKWSRSMGDIRAPIEEEEDTL